MYIGEINEEKYNIKPKWISSTNIILKISFLIKDSLLTKY